MEAQTARQFIVGHKMEFNNDGDICTITRSFSIRGKYCIEYKSLKSGKRYSNTRNDLMRFEGMGLMRYIDK